MPATVVLDHNYGVPAALRYQTAGGVAIEGAVIRVYRKIDFDQGLYNTALGVTSTNVRGDWVDPVTVPAGVTYTIQFHKEGLYGPDHVDVVC